jgi:hypothetical protein
MNDDDLLQLWSYCDGEIVRLVAQDFTYCVVNLGDPSEDGHFDVRNVHTLDGDFRYHYRRASKLWKRIA